MASPKTRLLLISLLAAVLLAIAFEVELSSTGVNAIPSEDPMFTHRDALPILVHRILREKTSTGLNELLEELQNYELTDAQKAALKRTIDDDWNTHPRAIYTILLHADTFLPTSGKIEALLKGLNDDRPFYTLAAAHATPTVLKGYSWASDEQKASTIARFRDALTKVVTNSFGSAAEKAMYALVASDIVVYPTHVATMAQFLSHPDPQVRSNARTWFINALPTVVPAADGQGKKTENESAKKRRESLRLMTEEIKKHNPTISPKQLQYLRDVAKQAGMSGWSKIPYQGSQLPNFRVATVEQEFVNFFVSYDKNGDDVLNVDEFVTMMTEYTSKDFVPKDAVWFFLKFQAEDRKPKRGSSERDQTEAFMASQDVELSEELTKRLNVTMGEFVQLFRLIQQKIDEE